MPTIAVSEEYVAPAGDLEICYQTFGDPSDDPLLLVMGLGGPMTWWDPELCATLAERGFFVIRFDNRDTGRSSRIRHRVARTDIVRAFLGAAVDAAYSMTDLADDAFAVLDHLGLESAHLAGASMGGMIAQTMAIAAPDRVRSLTSIMSSTGARNVGWQHPRLFPGLLAPRGAGRDAYVTNSTAFWSLIGSPAYPSSADQRRSRAEDTWDRGFSASGVMRQMVAVLTQTDRSAELGALTIPVTVLHGLSDRMVHVSGGRATARAVPDAELMLIDGMGHDFPPALFPTFAEAIRRTADRSEAQ